MVYRIPTITLFLLLTSEVGFGQSSYKNLTPGRSTRADVERALGQPVRQVAETLSEYKSPEERERIFVNYRSGTAVVERITATYPDTLERSAVLQSLSLPAQATASQINATGRFEEYFATAQLVLTYYSADPGSGVSRVGYYTRELFESELAGVPRSPEGQKASDAPDSTGASTESKSTTAGHPTPRDNSLQFTLSSEADIGGLVIPEGTEFTVVTTEKISSKAAVEGDRVILKVNEPVIVKGRLVINMGTPVKGSIANAERSGRMGKGGKLVIRVDSTTTVDGQEIRLRASKSKEGGAAVVSTVTLTVLFGPLGLLKKGGEATIKEGTSIKVYTDEEKRVATRDRL